MEKDVLINNIHILNKYCAINVMKKYIINEDHL